MGYLAPAAGSTTGPRSYLGGSVTAIPEPEQEGHSLPGFLGNVLGGVGELVQGVGSIAGAGLHDLLKAGTEAVTLGKADWGGGYQTDEIVTGLLPAIGHDLAERYGSLSPFDDRPASEFFQQLYDKPVSFGLDALAAGAAAAGAAKAAGVASLGGKAAVKAALAEGAQPTGALGTFARTVSELETAGVATRTAKAAGLRSALDELAKGGAEGIAQTLKPLLPSQTFRRFGNTAESLKLGATSYNPVTRAVKGATFGKVASEPLARLGEEIADDLAHLTELSQGDRVLLGQKQALFAKAQDLGMTTIETQKFADFRASQLGRTLNKVTSNAWFHERLRATKAERDIWTRVKNALTPDQYKASSARATGTNVLFGDLPIDEKIALRIGDQAGEYIVAASLDGAVPTLRSAVSDTTRTALEGTPALARTDALLTKLDDFKQRIADNADDLKAANPDFNPELQIRGADRMAHDLISDIEHRADGTYDAHQLGQADQRILDTEKMSTLWDNYQYTPAQIISEAMRSSQVLHGAEVLVGDGAGARTAAAARVVEDWVNKRAKELSSRQTRAAAKIENFVTRRQEALFNKAPFDQPMSLADAEKVARQEIMNGTAPGTILKAQGTLDTLGAPQDLAAAQATVREGALPGYVEQAQATAEKYGSLDATAIVTGPDWETFHDAFVRNDLQAPVYYPHINNIEHNSWDWFLPRKRVGAVTFARDPHFQFNTEALFRAGNYITDPIEAYTRRAARGVRLEGTTRMINTYLEQSGRPITNVDQLATGEVVMAPAMVFLRKQLSNKFDDLVSDMRLKGIDPVEAGVNAFYQIGREAQDSIVAKLADAGGIKMYAVPEIVAKHMNDAAKWGQIIPKGARLYVDGPMNVWRSLVLAGSPRWIVNNVIGNTIFSIMQGAPVTRAFHLLEQRWKRVLNESNGGKGLLGHQFKTGFLDSVERTLDELGLRDQIDIGYNKAEQLTYRPALGKEGSTTRAGRFIEKSREAPGRTLSGFQKIGNRVRDFNSEIEAAFRENSFITAAERVQGISKTKAIMGRFRRSQTHFEDIMKDGLSPAKVKAALNEVNHFLGDFTNLGPLERHIVRRFVFPFWGFYKFQSKLLLTFPFEYPLKAEILKQLANVTDELQSVYGPRPDWLQTAIPLGPPGAEVKFLTTAGPNPFSGLLQNPISQLSPLFKIPLEQLQKRDTFTGQRFSDENTFTPFGSDQSFDIRTGEPVGPPTPGLIEAILGQIPQYELLKQVLAGGKTYDTANIFAGRSGAIKDKEGNIKYPTTIQEQLVRFLGFPTTTFSLENYQKSLEEGSQQALKEAIRRAG